jgi:hypothetical protein
VFSLRYGLNLLSIAYMEFVLQRVHGLSHTILFLILHFLATSGPSYFCLRRYKRIHNYKTFF